MLGKSIRPMSCSIGYPRTAMCPGAMSMIEVRHHSARASPAGERSEPAGVVIGLGVPTAVLSAEHEGVGPVGPGRDPHALHLEVLVDPLDAALAPDPRTLVAAKRRR